MLSERPNVRVHGDPAIMCSAREVRRGGPRNAGAAFLWFVETGLSSCQLQPFGRQRATAVNPVGLTQWTIVFSL